MQHRIMLSVVAAAALSACGGDADNASPAPVGASSIAISGTAAVGAAIAGGAVEVKCASGSGSATTGADGRFSLVIEDVVRPCVLAVTATGGTTLHSLIDSGTGTEVVANITPLSELMVATLAGGSPSGFYSNFDSAAQAKLTPAGVSGARDTVTLALRGVIDLTGVDPLSDPLQAANGGNAGNELDQKLDALGAALGAAQVTIDDVSSAIGANPGAPAPVQTLLQPAAESCASLRSGTYRTLDLLAGGDANNWKIQIDATALTVAYPDGTSESLTDGGGCQFTVAAGSAEPASMFVSKSGVAVVRNGADNAPGAPVLMLPEQAIALSELAGTWNLMSHEFGDPGEPMTPYAFTYIFDANGTVTAGADCGGFETCVPDNRPVVITVNPDGGFDFTENGTTTRLFAFKSADGHLTLYFVDEFGFYVAARQQPQTLPAVGFARSYWDLNINGAGQMSAATPAATEVTALDVANKSYTRQRASDGRLDTWTMDQFRNGISHRAANSMTINGVPQTHGAAYSMSLPGVGIGVVAVPATSTFVFSVTRP